MAFCRYCGASIKDGVRFCKNCGKQLIKDSNTSFQVIQQTSSYSTKIENAYSQNGRVLCAGEELIVDGKMGQILKVYNDHFLIETCSAFSNYMYEANRIYNTRGASEPEGTTSSDSLFEGFAEIGREFKSIFSDMGKEIKSSFRDAQSLSSTNTAKREVVNIKKGVKGDFFKSCSTIEGINIGERKRGYIKVVNQNGIDMLFFFDGRDNGLKAKIADAYGIMNSLIGKTCSVPNAEQVPPVPTDVNNTTYSEQKNDNKTETIVENKLDKTNVEQTPSVVNTNSSGDKIEQIKNIKEMLDSGVITKEEFEKLKKDIIY